MVRRREHRRGHRGVGGADTALPALSTLSDLPGLDALGVSTEQHEAYEAACARLSSVDGVPADELALGCVVRLDRGFPVVMCERGALRAEFSAQLTKGDHSRAAVGDWACVRAPAGHDMGLIEELLPRRSDLARWRGGARGERQTLAANVDVVLATQVLGRDVMSCERLARTAIVARDCGCGVAVVLTKADRSDATALAQAVSRVRTVLGAGVDIVVTCVGDVKAGGELESAATGAGARWGIDAARDIVGPGVVGIVLGESGAGKSTLVNALLGRDALATGAVRERDDRGRHTTVARRMVRLPGAGVLVDAPGLRSLPLVGHERGLSLAFGELAAAAQGCRFRDCTHTHEPGCMVRAGLDEGRFPAERVSTFLSLAAEMRDSAAQLDPDVAL